MNLPETNKLKPEHKEQRLTCLSNPNFSSISEPSFSFEEITDETKEPKENSSNEDDECKQKEKTWLIVCHL